MISHSDEGRVSVRYMVLLALVFLASAIVAFSYDPDPRGTAAQRSMDYEVEEWERMNGLRGG